MTEQFDTVLVHFIPSLIKEIHTEELAGNIFSLDQRWNYISRKLRVSQMMGQYQAAIGSKLQGGIVPPAVSAIRKGHFPQNVRPPSPNDRNCFKCGQTGHLSRDCKARSPRSSPRRMESPRGSTSSGFSRSSRSSNNSPRHSKSFASRPAGRTRHPSGFSSGDRTSPRGRSPNREKKFSRFSPRSPRSPRMTPSGSSSSRSSFSRTPLSPDGDFLSGPPGSIAARGFAKRFARLKRGAWTTTTTR